MYYLIEERLVESDKKQIRTADAQFVAVLTSAQWKTEKDSFDMGIDIEPDSSDIHSTKAEVNYDSLTGSFAVPSREKPSQIEGKFAFALDEKGIVFIDDSGTAEMLVLAVQRTKKWRLPSLERFLYDFLEQIVKRDRDLLEHYDKELDAMEGAISNEKGEMVSERVNEIRTEIRDLRVHYEQLLDFGQELEENENSFFKQDNLRYFRLFSNRIDRLRDSAVAISDHASQIRDIYKAHLDIKQNRIMTVLTIVTTIFMPLTLIAGWYGMNFRYMPELDSEWGYPIAITVSLLIVVGSLVFFKLKKWL
ncbi:magnesium transporter CorA family protein [Ruminococcus difficilis]|uniref:Magnesium transporter CorA n=1 Tax=Ruminococcus difficilis TaxID=2763069 RepID=A0A935C403_9FIRM|nr:CorA family divalent cation transporter [Ruminococcus difficilis]MBK6090029.1 magnesium transporter CorA [Ruminococcus difficilis]